VLILAVKDKGVKVKRIVSRMADDDKVDEITQLARGILLNNKLLTKAFIYLKSGNGSKPTLIRRVTRSWTGKVKTK